METMAIGKVESKGYKGSLFYLQVLILSSKPYGSGYGYKAILKIRKGNRNA